MLWLSDFAVRLITACNSCADFVILSQARLKVQGRFTVSFRCKAAKKRQQEEKTKG